MDILIIAVCAVTCLLSLITLIIVLKKNNNEDSSEEIVSAVRREISSQQSVLRQELTSQTQTSVKNMGDMLLENQRSFSHKHTSDGRQTAFREPRNDGKEARRPAEGQQPSA